MKKIFISLAVISTLVFATISCKKNNNNTNSVSNMQSLNQLFSGLRNTPQSINVTAGRDTIVYGTNGTMLHFYTYSFKDGNNNTITSGTINLQLLEMYKAGDMISNRTTTTTASGQILQSGGEVSIVATLNGQQVSANKYGVGFRQTMQSPVRMAMFYGAIGNADSVATWTQSDTIQKANVANGTTALDSTGANGYPAAYIFDSCANFAWANCDWFYNTDSSKTSVSVILPDTSFNPNNTELFLVLPNVNGQMAMMSNIEPALGSGSYNAATNTLTLISEGNTAIVPAGINYKLVVIANKNGTYYYYEQPGTIPHNGLTATATMTQDSQQDIKNKLSAL